MDEQTRRRLYEKACLNYAFGDGKLEDAVEPVRMDLMGVVNRYMGIGTPFVIASMEIIANVLRGMCGPAACALADELKNNITAVSGTVEVGRGGDNA